ncbi:MAG: hypothetical protein M3R68_01630 [Acidobacteriota bacterium]|nr:hypothetical protein [Acidobacteriota bacterium]
MDTSIDKRFQSQLIVWLALLMSVLLYFLLAHFAAPKVAYDPRSSTTRVLVVALTVAAIAVVAASFFVRRALLARSVERQEINLVQQAHVVAYAMCEVSALLGLLACFVIGYPHYYFLMLLGAIGIAAQFPRREHLMAASPKIPIGGTTS